MTIPEQTGEENQVRMTRNVLMTYQKLLEEPEEDNYNLQLLKKYCSWGSNNLFPKSKRSYIAIWVYFGVIGLSWMKMDADILKQ